MKTMVVAVSSILLFITAAGGQTAVDLAKKYRHHEVYDLAPGVQMTPKFDSTGTVCEMQVEQAHFLKKGIAFSSRIDEREGFSIIDDLVPVTDRGPKLNTYEECMGICQTTHEYSKVVISVSVLSDGDTRLITIKWRNRTCS